MASTSVSSIQKSFKYDVFLSFRGEDTRRTFVDHLYHALHNRGITTYKDDERIEKGKRISNQLMRSIEESKFHIIVFSKNYASSSWCLDELVKIMECQNTATDQTAYPIFYDVEPTEVRNQSGVVGEAFEKHIEKEAVGRWRDALKEAASMAGWELKNTVDGHEAKFIQKIVIDISLKLSFVNWSVDENLVGMETRVKNVISSLEIGIEDVRMIGIKGMGGGGKTTLATAVFDHISIWFEGVSFVENAREVSKGSLYGLKELQKQVLSDVLNDQSIVVKCISDGKNKMKKMMCGRKVLVVLDDVDNVGQLEALAGNPNWFKPGSRIIITTRDEQVLVAHRVNFIHDVSLLSNEEATCLFSRYAFGKEIPIQGYEELSKEVVKYAAGLPLTIRVLGSFLCDRTESEWEYALKRLKTIPLKETLEKLEISYDGLEDDYKQIFLDVACLLKGMEKKKSIRLLESCGYHAELGLRVLEQKSLITISNDGRLQLHDHLEEMGMNIVRRLHPDEPYRHNRLWIKEEIEDILVNDLGTQATRSVKLIYRNLHSAMIMKGLRKMKGLRFLYIDNVHKGSISNEADHYLPNTLRCLCWSWYPFECLPKTFQANKLVCLEMQYSGISQLWEGEERKVLGELRFLNLNSSKLRNLNLGLTPNLEELNLSKCYDLVDLKIPDECPKLKFLVLIGSKLSKLNLGLTPYLEELDLSKCYDLVELNMPNEFPRLKFLILRGSKLSKLNLGLTPYLEELDLNECSDLVELSMPNKCPKLKFLYLSGSKLSKLNLGLTPYLEELDLNECFDLVELNMPNECPKLKFLKLSGSKLSNLNLGLTPHLVTLNLKGCNDFVELNMPVECSNLKIITISDSKVRNLNLGMAPNLEELNLGKCNLLEELHMPNECPKLKFLYLSGSKLSKLDLGLTPYLEELDLNECFDLVELNMPNECPKLKFLKLSDSKLSNLNLGLTPHLVTLNLKGCNDFVELNTPGEYSNLKILTMSDSKVRNLNLGMAPNLEELNLGKCNLFEELHMPIECPKLKFLYLSGSKVKYLNLGMTPHLEILDLEGCYCLQEFQAPVGCLKKLVYLNLSGFPRFKNFLVEKRHNIIGFDSFATLELTAESLAICPLHLNSNLPKFQFKCKYYAPLPSSSGNLEKLISFGLCACTNLESFSATICGLQHLRVLTLEGCIPEVPKDLYRLDSLEKLTLWMKEIKHLPDSICMLKHLKSLELKSCWLLEQLPKDLGRLECLEELYLTDCISLQDIPSSVCKMKCLRYLWLPCCILVDKLPKKLGCLERLKVLNIEGAGISQLPQSIFQLKELRIIGSTWRLESYGFTSLTEISTYTASCLVGNYFL